MVACGAPLRHVTLYQGGKAYGAHLGYFNSPAKERDPRLVQPNFYYDQEDVLRARAAERGFAVTVLRPEGVIGYAVGNPMNLLMVIAVYASICRELGQPLRFPGTVAAYDALYQVTDADLLARATVWSGSEPGLRGRSSTSPTGTSCAGANCGPPSRVTSGWRWLSPSRCRWSTRCRPTVRCGSASSSRHDLRTTPYEDLVAWQFGDFLFGSEFDNVCSTVKARQAGFHDCLDSEDRFRELFDGLVSLRVIPPVA